MVLRAKFIGIILFVVLSAKAQNDSVKHITINGQLTTWGVAQLENNVPWQLAGRFVPTILGNFALAPQSKLDFEASLNINGSINFDGLKYDNVTGQLKPYRVWVRYSGQNWEMRAGLQKINFGSAKMFRPLMWFDGMDVRDPLQLTDGVYGALGRYYFPNNANIWLWTLIGNKNTKGYEMFGTDQWKPEVGGRYQMPIGLGQMGLSTNFRKVHVPNLVSSIPDNDFSLNEERIGLDGKWDIGIGLWFESSVTLTDKKNYVIPTVFSVQDAWNIGADYTFGIGNGLGVTVEYFRYHLGQQFLTGGSAVNLIGTMLTYPISMLDNLSAMVFYTPDKNLAYNYFSWSRTYDNWSLYAIGFWNPNVPLTISQSQNRNLFSGKGIQLMVSYNF
jgi:hypothetical protein